MCECEYRLSWGEVANTRIEAGGTNKKRKTDLDIANKKRNTTPCFEVGYVSSSILIDGGYSYPPAPRITNRCKTLS